MAKGNGKTKYKTHSLRCQIVKLCESESKVKATSV